MTLHYLLAVARVENMFLLSLVMVCLVTLGGVMISKLSIDPLEEHVSNLQNLSKETLHELNLPTSTIITNVQMLQKNSTDEKERKRLARIENACKMLLERYNELDYMIKTQSLQIVEEAFDLDVLVASRVDFLKSVYPHVEFILDLEKTPLVTDKIGLAKAIDNIIDNGVKYSPKSNKIEIKITDFTLSIKDYGCGMDEVQLLRIFDNYYQCNKNMQGFGIGLGMVKRFCDRQEIALNFKSAPDQGTSVTLTFKSNQEGKKCKQKTC